MSDHIERTIADCQGKMQELASVIEKLRWFQREFPNAAAAVTTNGDKPKRKYTRGGKAKRLIKTNKQTNKQTKQGAGHEPSVKEPP